jgi:hypothetical protein
MRLSRLKKALVIPGDHRETRDPFRNLFRKGSEIDPGSVRLRRLFEMTMIAVEP